MYGKQERIGFSNRKKLPAHDFSCSSRIAILTCVTVKNCSLLCFIIRGVRFRYIFRHPRACKHLVAFHIYSVGKQIDILTYILYILLKFMFSCP